VKLVGNGHRFPMDALDCYRASLVPLPARLLYERQNVQGSQLRLANDADLRGSSVLLVTGTHDMDHPREIDEHIARWLAERGAGVDFVWLADRGITGNGHMMMLEDNSAEIAGIIGGWIRAAGG
jgi:pimeloyl-ACP methyl ester carboxylesterase